VKYPRKILVFRQSSLGDIILTLPVVKVLRENYPRAVIDYLTKQPYEPIVKYNPALKNIYSFNNNDDFQKRLKQVRAEKYDLIIDLQRNFRSLALSIFNPLTKRVKYKKRRLAREMVVRKPSAKLSVDHTINAYFHTLRKLGIESDPSPPEIFLSDKARDFAGRFIAKSFAKPPAGIIALCPGARHPEKMWPWENFKSVAEFLLQDESLGLLVVSAASDSIPENLDISSPRLVPVKDFEILRVAALLSHCRTALTNDSGLMHLANAVGTTVAAIFGPTSPRLGFSPTLPGSTIISNNVFCSPCSLHGEKPCSQPTKYCFENIEPRQVVEIVRKNLQVQA
jgi:ADP-heptose:LPS heptosyltransferase